MIRYYPLDQNNTEKFRQLFADYYEELGCDEEIDHLLDEYVLADYADGLLHIDLLDDEEQTVGFIIFQVDEKTNEWNFKEGWGDIREIYLEPLSRGKKYGKFMVYAAEMKLQELGSQQAYVLPFEGTEGFFAACGYAESKERSEELECTVFEKHPLTHNCGCAKLEI